MPVFNKKRYSYLYVSVYMFMLVILLLRQVPFVHAKDVISLGYLTGSHRCAGNPYYPSPGQKISGAITMAVNEINNNSDILPNHELQFVVMETYGLEEESLRQVVTYAPDANISAVIGPQETCIHEGRVAASFNLPMISYVSRLLQSLKFYIQSEYL